MLSLLLVVEDGVFSLLHGVSFTTYRSTFLLLGIWVVFMNSAIRNILVHAF